jgi:peptide/nickel transport system ATP-binding protein
MTGSSDPLLAVTDLRVAARTGTIAVDRVSFAVGRGEILALVGESGSGKTATARAIVNLLPAGLAIRHGAIRFQGEDLVRAPLDRLRRLRGAAIGMVFQEPMVSLNPTLTLGRQMAEGLALHTTMSGAEIRRACLAMLDRVGIADAPARLAAYPHEFSGGMRQRIMLASVMLLRPKLLIADEPTTALDTLTQAEILDLMVGLTRDHATAVLLITHNLGLVARYADRAIVMRAGRIVEQGAAKALLTDPQETYTRELIAAMPRRGPARPSQGQARPLLQAEGLTVDYGVRRRLFSRSRAVRAVDHVDLIISTGEVVALVGGSGSGKTTLGRAMLRLVDAAAGHVLFCGEDVTRRRGSALLKFRLACQIVYQDPYSSLDPRMRVAEIVAEPLRLASDVAPSARAQRVQAMLEDVGLGELSARFPHELSGGQRQRVAIARALVRRPDFVLADEPVSALDMTVQKQILGLLQRLQRERGFACLFVSHDLSVVEEIADRVIVMRDGSIVEQGTRDEIFDRPRHAYTKALLAAAPRLADLAA